MFELSSLYIKCSQFCIVFFTVSLLLSTPVFAEEETDEGQWLFPQKSVSFKPSLIKSTLRDNRFINALRATKNAVTIDFQKPQTKYFEYNWDDTSWEEQTIKFNMHFRFH